MPQEKNGAYDMRCLIIDDSTTSRLFAKKCTMMSFANQDVLFLEAHNGEDALQKLKEHQIDLIISDVNMPVMNGFTFLRNVKANQTWKNIPVIFITSLANDERKENLMALGAHAVLKKPLSPKELAQSLAGFSPEQEKEKEEESSWGS
jgi:two-component system, chemotaxis family, chemotaxis protein CheY